ncbi:MAG: response regulator [Planctomycetes bacterium]|nr:response regulator [Planctomycetota bacterium]
MASHQTQFLIQKSSPVLVVDDDAATARMVVAALKLAGIEANAATNGRTAFRAASSSDVQVIVMDLQLPEWDGLSAIRSIGMTRPEVKIVVFSAYLNPSVREDLGGEPGVVAVVNKPDGIPEVVRIVRASLSGIAGAGAGPAGSSAAASDVTPGPSGVGASAAARAASPVPAAGGPAGATAPGSPAGPATGPASAPSRTGKPDTGDR